MKSSLSRTFPLLNFWLNYWPIFIQYIRQGPGSIWIILLIPISTPCNWKFFSFFQNIKTILENLTFTKFECPKLDHKKVLIFFHPNPPFLNTWYSILEKLHLPKEKMWPNSTETIKLLIFQYYLHQGLLIYFRTHQFHWNKYQANLEEISENLSLNHLNHQSFPGLKRLFKLSIENAAKRTKWIQDSPINLN